MTAQPSPRRPWRISRRLVAARPRFSTAAALGLVVGVAAAFAVRPSAAFLAGWDVFCVTYLTLLAPLLHEEPATIRRHAAQQDEGQAVILLVVLAACVASLSGACLELAAAQHAEGLLRVALIAAAGGTVAVSWLVTQTTFALHYAHGYYSRAAGGKDAQGLAFPGGGEPDYGDFLHFAIIIGVAAQTADIAFTDRRLRRLGTLHSLIAFVFNTLIVALTISLLAGLF